jgi:hypothetical protein
LLPDKVLKKWYNGKHLASDFKMFKTFLYITLPTFSSISRLSTSAIYSSSNKTIKTINTINTINPANHQTAKMDLTYFLPYFLILVFASRACQSKEVLQVLQCIVVATCIVQFVTDLYTKHHIATTPGCFLVLILLGPRDLYVYGLSAIVESLLALEHA